MVTSEVSVVAGDDGVLLSLSDVLSVPLPNAGTTGVSKDNACSEENYYQRYKRNHDQLSL